MLNERIKEERIMAGLTQEELADKIGVKQNMVSYYEKGFKTPSVPILARIADVLDCSVDKLLERT